MVLSRSGSLPNFNIRPAPLRPETGRGEIVVAIADLAANVEKLAGNVNRLAALVDTAKVTSRGKGLDRTEGVASAVLARDLSGRDRAEATNIPLSPHQDSWKSNVYPFEKVDEVNSGIEAKKFAAEDASSRAKNAIACRVLDLHDRLGGFIKPLPLPPSDQKRR